MTAPKEIIELVERFGEHLDAYRNGVYKEAQLRQEFLDPFFRALGWDMDNSQGFAEAYKEVIHEDSVKIGDYTKAPDYSFRVGGTRKYFVEAKKPSVYIKGEPDPAFQLRRYAWSAKLPLSILTDFEEFAIYDCRIKPSKNDPSATARIQYWTYTEYAEKWDEIAAIFSKDAVLKGSFDKFAATTKGKRGTAAVDSAFLDEIETWRESLAKNIALSNPELSQRALNYAVQQTIDRIVFLRICEDRGIEPYGQLRALANGANVYQRLTELFHKADQRYNSGLFHFHDEKDRSEPPDKLTLKLEINDKPLKEIFQNFYYPDSPYEFSVIGADILGSVYERFLGKVIRLTAGHRAKIEEKPEVKKAGGVYYTPTYIVDYIVRHTVGKLVEGKTPKEVEKLRILDPACGSGSFLIGAYQYLLDWHRDWYEKDGADKHVKGKQPQLWLGKGGMYRLTTSERKRILINNIYGVDIDAQAVEVTKLSLLLKVLEGESDQTLQTQLFHERVLPDLGRNIQCGNSLIGPDFYDGQLDLDDEAAQRINVFDWQAAFPQVFKIPPNPPLQKGVERSGGGFDVVIGNPPYIQLSMSEYYNRDVNLYFNQTYSSSMGRLNTFGLFIDRCLRGLLRKNASISFIVPNTLLTQEYYQSLRKQILNYHLENITTYRYPVFKGAVVETIVFVIKNQPPNKSKTELIDYDNKSMTFTCREIDQEIYHRTHNNSFLTTIDSGVMALKGRLDEANLSLSEIANINQAIALKHDRSKSLFTAKKATNYKPVLDGRNINRYSLSWGGQYLAYNVENIHSCKSTDIFEAKEKIFIRRVGERLIATYDDGQHYALNTLVVVTLRQPSKSPSIKFTLALLNSNLLNFYYAHYLKSTKKVFSEIQARQLAQLPIRTIDLANAHDHIVHAKFITLVEKMLALHQQLAAAKTPQDTTLLQRQIAATDNQIDQLVYALYGLSEEEIALVEGT